jgi:predicted lipid carrier protein YhbT
VHRWDAQTATGISEPIDHALAVDGIDEFFALILFWKRESTLHGAGESIHLHATDGDGEWFVRLATDGVIVTKEHAKGDVALRAPASDLLLFLYGRVGPVVGESFGDASLLERWQRLVKW